VSDFLKEVLMNKDLSKIPDGGIGSFLAKAIQGFKKPEIENPAGSKEPVAQPGQLNILQSLGK